MDMDFGFDANGGGADAGDLTKKYHTPADNDKNKQAKHSSTQPGSNKGTPPSQNTVTRPTTMASAGTVLLAEAKAFADPAELTAIPEASVSELRRSKRVASTSDEEVMHQATRLRADKDNAVQSYKVLTGAHTVSDYGLYYKGVMKTRRSYRRHVEPWRFWSCRSLPIMNGSLVIKFALNKCFQKTVSWLQTSCLVLCE